VIINFSRKLKAMKLRKRNKTEKENNKIEEEKEKRVYI